MTPLTTCRSSGGLMILGRPAVKAEEERYYSKLLILGAPQLTFNEQ